MLNKPWFLSQGPVLGATCRHKTLTTDASLTGWGAILEGRSSQGLWKDHHLSWQINHQEMLAVFLALKNFLAYLKGHHVSPAIVWRSIHSMASRSTRSMAAPRPLYQELLSKRFVMRQFGPHRTHSSDFILQNWILPQVPKCFHPSAAR